MTQNFLYMFEFVVDDLLITRPNCCAPEEYPTCCEISFRSSVFVSICDREFGASFDSCTPSAKCCLFPLESPVTEKDRLFIHIYKKKTDKCKFLVGATDLPVKPLFDKVTESFNIENPNWMEQLAKHTAHLPDSKSPSKTTIVDNDCDEDALGGELCPTSELTKRLLPLFNMRNLQTGNLVLIMRLVCNGPTLVSSFPFAKIGSNSCDGGRKQQSPRPTCPSKRSGTICTTHKDDLKMPVCRRYFACNADKCCPCDDCEDECDQACPAVICKKNQKKPKPSTSCQQPLVPNNISELKCNCEECTGECEAEEEFSEEESSEAIRPCFICPSKPDPGPEAYEEFEACLNASGLVIRILKDTHVVQGITDGNETCLEESGTEGDTYPKIVRQRSVFARNHINRRTAGHIVNHQKLPKINANIKYSGNDDCCSDNYHVPFTKIKQKCEEQNNKLNMYRKKKTCDEWEGPKHEPDLRNCCIQVDPADMKNRLNGINVDARKKGIEVCYKTCDDTESDVFLVKLGSKQRCQKKKNSIEIELKTPKQPLMLPIQKITTETQIFGAEIDAAISGVCKKNGKKGKKGKKGGNKGK